MFFERGLYMTRARVLPLQNPKTKRIDSIHDHKYNVAWQRIFFKQDSSQSLLLSLNIGLSVSNYFKNVFLPKHFRAERPAEFDAKSLERPLHYSFINILERGKKLTEYLSGEGNRKIYSYDGELSTDHKELKGEIKSIEEREVKIPGIGLGKFKYKKVGISEIPLKDYFNFFVLFEFIIINSLNAKTVIFNHTNQQPEVSLALDVHCKYKDFSPSEIPKAYLTLTKERDNFIQHIGASLQLLSRQFFKYQFLLNPTLNSNEIELKKNKFMEENTENIKTLNHRIKSRYTISDPKVKVSPLPETDYYIKHYKDYSTETKQFTQSFRLFFSPRKQLQKNVAQDVTGLTLLRQNEINVIKKVMEETTVAKLGCG